MKFKILFLGLLVSLFFGGKVEAYQVQPKFDTGKVWSSATNRGLNWFNWDGLSTSKVDRITLSLSNGSPDVSWKLTCWNKTQTQTRVSDTKIVTEANFYTFKFTDGFPENQLYFCTLGCVSGAKMCGYPDYKWHLNMFGANYDASPKIVPYGGDASPVVDYYLELFTVDDVVVPPFKIISPKDNEQAVKDSWITVSGTCPVNGENRIGLTNNCTDFSGIKYDLTCKDYKFTGQFYFNGLGDKRVVARDKESVSQDCADYDDLMDYKTLSPLEIINGYPNDWYFNFDYYNDYDIKRKSPNFDTALTLPLGSTSALFNFGFNYPSSSSLAGLAFNIKQYDENGTVLNANYHTKKLSEMADTWNYPVSLAATSTKPLHYVVQLTENGEMKRQYPFAIYVSDLNLNYNSDEMNYLFPRLVETLKQKAVFNYYFVFHDGFYNLFNSSIVTANDTALDFTVKSVSGNKEYNTELKIFSASDPTVKKFANGLRPYVTAILWLIFALYVVLRVGRLFGNNDE